MHATYEFNSSINTLSSHHSKYIFFTVAVMSHLAKKTLSTFFLQASCMRVNIDFVHFCWDDAISWKKIILKRRDLSFLRARSRF